MMMPGNKLDDEMLKQAAEEYSKDSGQAHRQAVKEIQVEIRKIRTA